MLEIQILLQKLLQTNNLVNDYKYKKVILLVGPDEN